MIQTNNLWCNSFNTENHGPICLVSCHILYNKTGMPSNQRFMCTYNKHFIGNQLKTKLPSYTWVIHGRSPFLEVILRDELHFSETGASSIVSPFCWTQMFKLFSPKGIVIVKIGLALTSLRGHCSTVSSWISLKYTVLSI